MSARIRRAARAGVLAALGAVVALALGVGVGYLGHVVAGGLGALVAVFGYLVFFGAALGTWLFTEADDA